MSLRARVALATTITTGLVVMVAGGALVRLVAEDQRGQVDATLVDQGRVAAQEALFEVIGSRLEEQRRPAPNLNVVGRAYLDGEVATTFGDFPEIESALPAGYSTAEVEGERWRFYSSPARALFEGALETRGPLGNVLRSDRLIVEVAVPTIEMETAIRDTRAQVVRVGIASVLAASILGLVLGTTAVRPLARLRRDAESVRDAVDLDLRVNDCLGVPEVDELGRTLNAMLDRIGAATAETEQALEASRAFAGNAAHELRTPLTSMQANLDVLERNPDLDRSEQAEIVADIQAQQARLLRLLAALRLLARGDLNTGPPDTPVDVTELIDRVVHETKLRHPDDRLSFLVDGGPWVVHGWEEGLEVMVANLLDNAIVHGASAAHTVVHVRIQPDTAQPGALLLTVEDNGPGLEVADRERVFARFERANTSAPGSGLGLALVAQQVDLHRGTVTITDSPLGGARFEVRLPTGTT